jgi:hypothetical protein
MTEAINHFIAARGCLGRKVFSNDGRRPLGSEQALDGGFDLVDHVAPRLRRRQLRVHLRGDQGQEFRIVHDERATEIAGSEDHRVARRANLTRQRKCSSSASRWTGGRVNSTRRG